MQLKRSTLWLGRATLISSECLRRNVRKPACASLHELAAPKMHSRYVTTPLVGSYPAFSPLPFRAVVFFCMTQPSRTASTLGSGMPCAARTFLSPSVQIQARHLSASDKPSNCFPPAKIDKKNETAVTRYKNLLFLLFRMGNRRM